jgi:translation initiation factor 2B subunit (eIF-2B alpha/beta/delta family)
MNPQDRQNLYKLIRDLADVLGTSSTTEAALEAFSQALQSLKCSREAFIPLFNELADAIRQTEPRIVPLIHLLEEFEEEMRFTDSDLDLNTLRDEAVRVLHEKLDVYREKALQLVEQGQACVQADDVILVHSASRTVIDILARARERLGRRFEVIVLQQDFAKTRQLIQALDQAEIPKRVIPEYTLSHFHGTASKLFLGAVAVTDDHQIVAAAGSANIVGLCHVSHVPIYLFVNSLKYSHQGSEAQQIHRKAKTQSREGVHYQLTIHSHDLVPLALIDHVITEQGERPSV